jgi:hypothetical protein
MNIKDFPGDKFCVLLDTGTQKRLVESAARNIGGSGKSEYIELAKRLQDRCESIRSLNPVSIHRCYIHWWAAGKKFIPIDCLVELCNLSHHSFPEIEAKIRKIKYKHASNNRAADYGNKERLFNFETELKYLKNNVKNKFDFINYFYGINQSQKDLKDINNFLDALELRKNGKTNREISDILGVSIRKIDRWISGESFPSMIWLLRSFFELRKPNKNFKWLSINSSKGGILNGPWIEVHKKITNFDDILRVISQLKPLPEFFGEANRLEIDTNLIPRSNFFAFVLGVLIGDSSKHAIKRKRRITRRITLRLSKRYASNEKFGEFTSMCVKSMGLRMKRCKDCPAGKCNPFPFYTWISQSSPLMQWIFTSCLGMKDNGLTTYDSIKADWILNTPNEFKVWFLQGLAESDGFIDFTACQAGIITSPNTNLIKRLLKSLSVNSRKRYFIKSNLWSLMMSIGDSHKLPLFNHIIKSYRYEKMEKMHNAKRISGHWPRWLDDEVKSCIKEGLSGTKLVERVIDKHNILIRAGRVNKKKREFANENGGDVIEEKSEMISLGIESTAH